MIAYLDIETDWNRKITVVGIHVHGRGFSQLVAPDISRGRIMSAIPREATLVTFRGHWFDLPVIKRNLRVDLRQRHDSVDLWMSCRDAGWSGGLKDIEKRLGIGRAHPDLDGFDAMYLWDDYQRRGDQKALATLLRYNRDDVMNMRRVRAALHRAGVRA